MKTLEILVGIPCSGKSTYAWIETNSKPLITSISRDGFRENFFKDYKVTKQNEEIVTKLFNMKLEQLLSSDFYNKIILDNTHCKEGYIDEIIRKYGTQHNITVKYFECSLIKAHWRNILRYFFDKKWIPFKVINQMYKNFNKINRNKYKKYESS